MSDKASTRPDRWWAMLPAARWLGQYRWSWLGPDAVAGITLAAYAIPVSMAYATLAGLPPQTGIYGYLIGGLFYALLGSSRHLAIGPTSAISLLVGVTVATMAGGDAARFAAIAGLTALLVGAMCLLAWLLRLSALVNFISETVLVGFKAGAALTIALTQLPKLFGVPGGGEHFIERVVHLAGQLGELNLVVLAFGLAAIVLLVAGNRLLPGRPVALAVVVLAISVMSMTALQERGVTIVGALPEGLPSLTLPSLRPRDVDGILPLAFAVFLLAYIEGVSAARALAERNGYKIDARQELLGLGAANIAASFGQGYPVAGGLSQSAVNEKAGAKSPLALVFASATLALCLLFLTSLLRNLPNVMLAAIVLVAVAGLIDVKQFRELWRINRLEFWVAMAALLGVLALGILKGVMLAALFSMLLLIARAARPHVAFLGRIPGTRHYSDLERHPENERIPATIIFRVEAGLVYFNVDHVHEVVMRHVQAESAPPRVVIADLSNVPIVDLAGARMLAALHGELMKAGASLRIVEAHAKVRDMLRAADVERLVGPIGRRYTVDEVIREIEAGV